MSMTAVLQNISKTQDRIIVDGTITLVGNYATNGIVLDLSHLGVPSNSKPTVFYAWSTVSQGAGLVIENYVYVPGTSQANGMLQIGVAGAEMANAGAFATTTPTNQTGYVLHFQAEFPALI